MLISFALFFQVAFAQPSAALLMSPNFALTAAQCQKSNFFAIPTWYKYIKEFDDDCSPAVRFVTTATDAEGESKGTFNGVVVTQILLAIVDILIRLAGLVAVAYVIYGGFIYILAKGEPDQIKRGSSTIMHALAGLVIAIMATAVVAFIGGRLGA